MATQTNMAIEREQLTVVTSRVFSAPRALVFQAFTDPDAIPHWWGPARYTTTVEHMDVRPGGTWRYVQVDADGTAHAFRGEYREVVPPERIVYTFEYEPMAGQIVVDTTTLEALDDGTTRVTVRSVFQSLEALEAMEQSGMEEGATESWDRLEAYLAARPAS